MICGKCHTVIYRGERFRLTPELREGAVHVECPTEFAHIVTDAERQREPELHLELKTPPDAS